jgi:zona occludens toxin
MIDLITGLPGNSKTLYTISFVRDWAARENRPVYYSGIPELTLDWQQIEPEKWMDVPPKSIVVIDEAQRIFRNRSLGAQPPKHVTDLETHRHLGIDLVFITQHPSLIDPAIRRLAGRHRHMVRMWGMEVSTIHKWDSVKDNCDKPAARKDSEKTKWAFDKSVYKLYKSSEEHTMKRSIPMRVKLLFAAPLVFAFCAYVAYHYTVGKSNETADAMKAKAGAEKTVSGDPAAAKAAVVAPGQAKFDPAEDLKHYVQMSTPRVEGLAQTAPKYDELTKPTRVPVPAACIQVADKCRCFSQQGTSLDVKYSMCIEFARNGFFQEFDPDRDRRDTERTAQSVKVLEGRGVEQDGSHGGRADAPQVAVFGNPSADAPRKPPVGL